jgi:hypothetical protein
MPMNERRKLDRFLINIELLGDLQKAAGKVGLPSRLLQQWMNTPEIGWVINDALMQSERIAKGEDSVFVPLWWSPEIRDDSRFWAKVASKNLKAAKQRILEAIENNDTKFFVDLGKCLSHEIDATLLDQRDAYVAGLLTQYPSITTEDAILQLRRVGFRLITKVNFRMLKKRLKGKVRTVHDVHASRYALHELAERLNIPTA